MFSSNMLGKHKDAMSTLLYFDTLRGRDSTGVAALRHNADTAILKSTVPGYEFVEGPKLGDHLKYNDFCWIGHNRYGTIGRNIKSNAHPFKVDDADGGCMLVGAHNGTLKNKHDLDDHAKFGTDSEALFHNIAHVGVKETIAKVEGAWALTWYDHLEEELRFLRNDERPLVYAFEEGKKTLIWASEMWMIRVTCARHDIKLEEDKVYSFVENTLYKFPVPLKLNQELTFERKGGLVGKKAPTFFRSATTSGPGNNNSGTTPPATQTTQRKGNQTTPSSTQGAGQSLTPNKTTTLTDKQYALITGNYSAGSQGPVSQGSSSQSGTTTGKGGAKQLSEKGTSSKKRPENLLSLPDKTGDNNIVDIGSRRRYKGYGGVLLTKKEIEDQLENGCGWCELEFICLEDRFAWLAPNKPICQKCLDGVPGHSPVTFNKSQLN